MLKSRIVFIVLTAITVILSGFWVLADTNLKVFKAGDPIKADEVNANFQSLASALPVKFNVLVPISVDKLTCVTVPGDYPGAKWCTYFFDHPALNGKPDAWVSIREDCDLFIGDPKYKDCEKDEYTNVEDKHNDESSDVNYDKTTQRWYIDVGSVGREDVAIDAIQQRGYNILVIP
jgi:hypothetical protein